MAEIVFGSSWEASRQITMIKVTTTTMATKVTTMITTTTKILAELDCKMQYFAAMHDCSCLFIYFLNSWFQ